MSSGTDGNLDRTACGRDSSGEVTAPRVNTSTGPRFDDLFGAPPRVRASAPGRVNLIGEHTDYNEGFVLPAALPLRTVVELSPVRGNTVRVWSAQFHDAGLVTFPLDAAPASGNWTDYARGMVRVLAERGLASGFDARIESQVPLGSGLSSSAALLIALGRAIREAWSLAIEDVDLAVLARKAETDFVGAPVGIMDQMACSLAPADGALFIDTRMLSYEAVGIPAGAELLVVDSGIRHEHVTGGYRQRRAECEAAAAALGVRSLRDLDPSSVDRIEKLPDPLNRRARHVVTENARVLAAVAALRRSDLREVGRLFGASHASMRDDFEVSTPEVDALVARLEALDGVYGARLTGGGFGGAVVALVERGRAVRAGDEAARAHNAEFPHQAQRLVPGGVQ